MATGLSKDFDKDERASRYGRKLGICAREADLTKPKELQMDQ